MKQKYFFATDRCPILLILRLVGGSIFLALTVIVALLMTFRALVGGSTATLNAAKNDAKRAKLALLQVVGSAVFAVSFGGGAPIWVGFRVFSHSAHCAGFYFCWDGNVSFLRRKSCFRLPFLLVYRFRIVVPHCRQVINLRCGQIGNNQLVLTAVSLL